MINAWDIHVRTICVTPSPDSLIVLYNTSVQTRVGNSQLPSRVAFCPRVLFFRPMQTAVSSISNCSNRPFQSAFVIFDLHENNDLSEKSCEPTVHSVVIPWKIQRSILVISESYSLFCKVEGTKERIDRSLPM